jgi:hypothetical protein
VRWQAQRDTAFDRGLISNHFLNARAKAGGFAQKVFWYGSAAPLR